MAFGSMARTRRVDGEDKTINGEIKEINSIRMVKIAIMMMNEMFQMRRFCRRSRQLAYVSRNGHGKFVRKPSKHRTTCQLAWIAAEPYMRGVADLAEDDVVARFACDV